MSELDNFIETAKGKKLVFPVDMVISNLLPKLNHVLPKGSWEGYMLSICKLVITSDISALKKTARLQKILRYIYDKEVLPEQEKVKILSEGFKVLHESNGFYGDKENYTYDYKSLDDLERFNYKSHDPNAAIYRCGKRAREAENNEAVKKALEVIK